MVHLRPIILALLLAVAAPAAAIPFSAPSLQSATTATSDNQVYAPANTSSVMTLGEGADETRAFVRPSLDVATTLAIQKQTMDNQFKSGSFAAQFEQADTRGDKRDLLIKYATRIDTQTVELESREKTAHQGFRNGSLSAVAYVRTLVLIDAKAEAIQQEVDAAKAYADDVNGFPLSGYLGPYEKRLVSFEGPVREELAATLRGDSSPKRYYVSAADNGVVLAFLTNGKYHREIYRADHRSIDGGNQISNSEMLARAKRLYPWASNDEINRGLTWQPDDSDGYYIFEFEHPHGEVDGRIDSSTGLVFQEAHQKYLTPDAAARNGVESTRPKGPGATANESGLLLTVNRSYAGGPMYVTLQENGTGDYVEGTVTVDGETVGHTSTDGGLWTLSPAGSFNVSASSGLDVVTVETRATRPITNHNATED